MVKGLGRAQSLNACRVGNLLVGDHTRYGCEDVDDSRGMVLVDAEKPQLFSCGVQIDLGILFGVFSLF